MDEPDPLVLKQIERKVGLLKESKTRETGLLDTIKSYFAEEIKHREDETWTEYLSTGASKLSAKLFSSKFSTVQYWEEVYELYEEWTTQILELRELYTHAGVPQTEWEISPTKGAPRVKKHEPNVKEFVRLAAKAVHERTEVATITKRYKKFKDY